MKNPYPEKIFPPIEEEEWRRIDELLRKELGFPLDRVSGNIGRIVWNNLMEDVKSAVQGLLEEVDDIKECVEADYENGWISKRLKEHTIETIEEIESLIKKWLADVMEERVK